MTIMTDLKSSYYQENLCYYLVRSRPQCGQNIFNFCLFLKLALIYRCAGFGVQRGSFSRQLKCWRNPRENKSPGHHQQWSGRDRAGAGARVAGRHSCIVKYAGGSAERCQPPLGQGWLFGSRSPSRKLLVLSQISSLVLTSVPSTHKLNPQLTLHQGPTRARCACEMWGAADFWRCPLWCLTGVTRRFHHTNYTIVLNWQT